MLPGTHRQISKLVFDIIQKDYNVTLRRLAFEYGSVKPDISPAMKTTSHTKPDSFFKVKEMINSFYKEPLPHSKKQMRKFSVELGVLLHFVADYFCCYHNAKVEDPLRKHFLYERRLAKRFSKEFREGSSLISKEFRNEIICQNSMDLVSYIDMMHKEYLKRPHGLSLDLFFCLDVCITVATSIIHCTMVDVSAAESIEALIG